jgi:hypothetical protein
MMAVGMALIACLGASVALGQTPTTTYAFTCAGPVTGTSLTLSSFNFGISVPPDPNFSPGHGLPPTTYTTSFRLPLDENYLILERAASTGRTFGDCTLTVTVTPKSPGDARLATESYTWSFTEVFIPKLTVVGSDGTSTSSGNAAETPSAYVTATISFASVAFSANTANTINAARPLNYENQSKNKKKR